MMTINTESQEYQKNKIISSIKNGSNLTTIQLIPPKTYDEAVKTKFSFWESMPVPKLTENITKEGIIEEKLNNSKNPLNLPTGFEWNIYNPSNSKDITIIHEFLRKHYTGSNDKFKLLYTESFLKWMLGKSQELCIGVRIVKTKKLVGFICANIITLQINKNKVNTAEINLLCVHEKLRATGLAEVLIREITRLCAMKGINVGFFTSSRYIPKPFSEAVYYHRPINCRKLIKAKFMNINSITDDKQSDKNKTSNTLSSISDYYKLESAMDDKFVKMEPKHIKGAYNAVCLYMEKYNFAQYYTLEEFTYWFSNNEHVVSYVYLDKDDNVSDFVSYYILPNELKEHQDDIKYIKIGYLQLYTSNKITPYKLIKNILLQARKQKMDVFNSLDIWENDSFFDQLKFNKGTAVLHYNLFNYKCMPLKNYQICKAII